MTVIHMETEEVRYAASQIDQRVNDLLDLEHTLKRAGSAASSAWYGGRKPTKYHKDYKNLCVSIKSQISALDTLATRLRREVDEWEHIDRNSSEQYRALLNNVIKATSFFLPAPWSILFFIPGVYRKIEDGIYQLYDVGQQTYKTTRDYMEYVRRISERARKEAVRLSDRALDTGLQNLLKSDPPGAAETMKFKVEGEVTIPATHFSGKLIGAGEGSLTRNEDGTYTLTLAGEGGIKAEEDLIEAKGRVKIGKETYGGGIDVGLEGVAKARVEQSFTFDPKVPGDMTEMAAFMGALGLSTQPGGAVLVGPTLSALKDNFSGLTIEGGLEGKVDVDAHALIKLAGVDASLTSDLGTSLEKVDGQWQASNYVELGAEGHVSLVTNEAGAEVKTTLESIQNLETGSTSAKVTVEIGVESGKDLKVSPQDSIDYKSLERYLPKGTDIKDIGIKIDQENKIVLEYTLQEPVESVKNFLQAENGQPDWSAITENSKFEVKQVTSTEVGLGASGEVGIVGESIGIGLEADMTRESERLIYTYPQ